MKDFDLEKSSREQAARKKRELFAMQLSGASGVETTAVTAVLDALRKTHRIVDKSRIVDLHTSRIRTHQDIELGIGPQIEDRMRTEDAMKMGRHLFGTGAVEFVETAVKEGREVRSTLYVIYPEPQRISMRDEVR